MARPSLQILARAGQGLASPSQQQHGRAIQNKSRDFFREVLRSQTLSPKLSVAIRTFCTCSSRCLVQVCRLLPWTVETYKLNELITVRELRSNVHALFRQNSHITNPGVRLPASLFHENLSCQFSMALTAEIASGCSNDDLQGPRRA